MKKILQTKYWWIIVVAGLVCLNILASIFHFRIDLTAEKRYTLSAPTKNLLRSLEDQVDVTVFLEGEMPAGFRQLSNASNELLQEFREYAGGKLQVKYARPGEGLDDSARAAFISYLSDSLGLKPTNVKVTAKAGEAQEERLVYPGALIDHGGKKMAINFLQGLNLQGGYESLNKAEALLEYKFANAIQKVTTDTVPVVGYLLGNGEPLTYNVYDLIENTLKPSYGFGFLPIDSVPLIPKQFDAVIIMKPSTAFKDEQKLKLDQYVMQGGKLVWMVDRLYAEMDSLMRTQSDFIAFDRGLNLDDLLFRYGVRINQDLLQDLQSDKVPLVVGNYGNEPQMQLVPWPYFPLLSSYSGHPISKNLGEVLSIFPNSLDTISSADVRKTVLLASSASSRTLSTPALVSLNSVKSEDDLKTFNRSHIPVAVLLEGNFQSLFSNRISREMAGYLSAQGQPFQNRSIATSMVVISDADIAGNVVTQKEGPLPMGYNQFTGVQYANKDFLLNCLEYLVNPSGILETRGKDIALRMLDPAKVEEGKGTWQLMVLAIPVLLVLLASGIYQYLRGKKYR